MGKHITQAKSIAEAYLLNQKEEKNRGGRPRTFKSPEELAEKIGEYIQWTVDTPVMGSKLVSFQGVSSVEDEPRMRIATKIGCCVFLGISETSWGDYRKREGFSQVIKNAEATMNSLKLEGASAGLLNPLIISRLLGLKDEKSVNVKQQIEQVHTIDVTGLDTNVLKAIQQARISAPEVIEGTATEVDDASD